MVRIEENLNQKESDIEITFTNSLILSMIVQASSRVQERIKYESKEIHKQFNERLKDVAMKIRDYLGMFPGHELALEPELFALEALKSVQNQMEFVPSLKKYFSFCSEVIKEKLSFFYEFDFFMSDTDFKRFLKDIKIIEKYLDDVVDLKIKANPIYLEKRKLALLNSELKFKDKKIQKLIQTF